MVCVGLQAFNANQEIILDAYYKCFVLLNHEHKQNYTRLLEICIVHTVPQWSTILGIFLTLILENSQGISQFYSKTFL